MTEAKFKAYNHIDNGGISYELIDTGKPLILGISVSQHGVITRFTTPILEDTSRMLRALADAIDKCALNGGRTPSYLCNGRRFLIQSSVLSLDEKPKVASELRSSENHKED